MDGAERPRVQVHDLLGHERRQRAGERERHAPEAPPASRPSAAPARPTRPQAAICQGVYGPWPSIEVGDQHPERADGEAGQRAERVADDERHRGDRLDVGQRDERVAPERRQRRHHRHDGAIRADGRLRSYASQPTASTRPTTSERGERPAHRAAPPARPRAAAARRRRRRRRSRRARAAQQLGSLLGQQRAAGAGEDAGGLGGEVPAAGEQLRGGPSAITRPSAIRIARSAQARRTPGRAWRRSPPGPVRRGGAAPPRARPWLRGPCRAWARRARAPPAPRPPPVTIASARRWRSPPERSRGLRSASSARPTAPARAAGPRGDALVHEVVAGVLQQQRHPPAALDAAAGRLEQAGGVAQQRRLAGAVAAHQRDALAGLQAQRDAAQDRRAVAQLVPHASHAQRRARARADARRRRRGASASGVAAIGPPDGCPLPRLPMLR